MKTKITISELKKYLEKHTPASVEFWSGFQEDTFATGLCRMKLTFDSIRISEWQGAIYLLSSGGNNLSFGCVRYAELDSDGCMFGATVDIHCELKGRSKRATDYTLILRSA